MNKRKIPVISIALYALAGLLVLYASWALYHSHSYISEMMELNQIMFSGNEFDIVNFYMTNSAQYVVFAVMLFTLGWMLQKNTAGTAGNFDNRSKGKANGKSALPYTVGDAEAGDEDFEEWFQNNDK
ncbi:hypothetical protein SAMN05421736_10613 [Evansella caseinilytica]|uniref:Uncharacterized protein n=1 Tax=Evansella caseinilytica TaxID=1503961 RepID=A0A1H3Q4P5_9BACI|nr:hypothetical protein [Evansella caseinilytica]SDZ08346.1 hypothetical protein SAMN05421736_10613 [Evansella caseinilytica]